MKRPTLWMGLVLAATGLLSGVAGASTPHPALPFLSAADFTPYWVDSAAKNPPAPATVSSFEFRNQAGRALTEAGLKGHVSLVSFFFTSCGSVCPRLMSQLQKVQRQLGSVPGLRLYSFSVMPEEDSPGVLTRYARARQMNLSNWDLITGDRDAIYRLGRGVFRADRNPDGTLSDAEFIHTQAIYLVDAQLRIRGLYQSDKPEDLRNLVADAQRLASGH